MALPLDLVYLCRGCLAEPVPLELRDDEMNHLLPPTVPSVRFAGGGVPDSPLTDNVQHHVAAIVAADAAGRQV